MGNKVTDKSSSRIIDNKLSVILKDLNDKLKDSPVDEREELLSSFNNAMGKFYKTITSPVLSIDRFRAGTLPEYSSLNKKLEEAGQDIRILYQELNSLQGFMVQHYNTLSSASSSVRARVRKVSSDLGDYKLYATDILGGAEYLADSFKNTDKADFTDSLYKEQKCFIDIFNGCATLPLDSAKTKKHTIEQLTISTSSNGTPGNNQELGALLRNKLDAISDDTADTWFEYEVVDREATSSPLVLELKIKLQEDSIVNTLDILTATFGSRKHPVVTRLEVSLDGVTFTSILDEALTSMAEDKNHDKVISLNPSAGNPSDSNKLYFSPRKITYINIVIQQNESYIIRTPGGTSFRKVIGIRGISAIGQAYKSKGELVSIPHAASSEIKKVAVANSYAIPNNVATTKTYISHNDGQDWTQVEELKNFKQEAPEILNYNSEGITGSISTQSPVSSIRYKILMERSAQAFSARAGVVLSEVEGSEFLTLSPSTQSISLKEKPIAGSVQILNTSYGSAGGQNTYLIPRSEIIERSGHDYVYLPHSPFFRNSIKQDSEIIRIQNQIWKRVPDITAETSTRTYEFDYLNNIIKFGNGTTGLKPGADIEFSLARERVSLYGDDKTKVVETKYRSDSVAGSTKIYRIGKQEVKAGVLLRKQGKVHLLGFPEVMSIVVTSGVGTVFASRKDYINGSEELVASGDYSIDGTTGVLYSFTPTPSNSDIVLSVAYRTKTDITGVGYRNGQITVPADQHQTEKVATSINITSVSNVISLPDQGIERGSLRFLTLASVFVTEVPFKGDGTEFNLSPSPVSLAGYYTVDYLSGTIYTYSPVSGLLYVDYNKSEYYAEYNIAVEIPKEEYSVDTEGSLIAFSDRYIVRTFSNSLVKSSSRTLFKTSYRFAREVEQNPRELEPFFTPVLKDYRVAILTQKRIKNG